VTSRFGAGWVPKCVPEVDLSNMTLESDQIIVPKIPWDNVAGAQMLGQ
jgi:hypothetical protein